MRRSVSDLPAWREPTITARDPLPSGVVHSIASSVGSLAPKASVPPRAQSLRRSAPMEHMSSSSDMSQPTPTLRTIHSRRKESFLNASTTGLGTGGVTRTSAAAAEASPAAALFVVAATLATLVAHFRHEALRQYRWTVLEPVAYYVLVVALLRDARAMVRALWAVVAAGALAHRRPAKLTAPPDHRVFQQAALFQVGVPCEEIGQEFDVTRERIRQIEAKALRQLRAPERARRLRALMAAR